MKKNGRLNIFIVALFPAIMALFTFICLVLFFIATGKMLVEPTSLQWLLFSTPLIFYVVITILGLCRKIQDNTSIIMTIATIVSACFLLFFLIFNLVWANSFSQITNIEKYEVALDIIGNPATSFFPSQISDEAKDVEFLYYPAIGQGGKVLYLKHNADEIDTYEYLQKAKWVGNLSQNDFNETGILDSNFYMLEDELGNLPSDLTIYLIYSEPYKLNNWNHGERSFVAISEMKNEIVFSFEQW